MWTGLAVTVITITVTLAAIGVWGYNRATSGTTYGKYQEQQRNKHTAKQPTVAGAIVDSINDSINAENLAGLCEAVANLDDIDADGGAEITDAIISSGGQEDTLTVMGEYCYLLGQPTSNYFNENILISEE
jgi:hypothetical protein